MEMSDLANLMQSPMPLELMCICRLRWLFHLIKVADHHLIAAVIYNFHLAGDTSWWYGAIKSVQWLQTQLGKETVPDELLELHATQTWNDFQPASRELKKLLKRADVAHLARVRCLCFERAQEAAEHPAP